MNDVDVEEIKRRRGSKLLLAAYGLTVLLLLVMVLVAGIQTRENYLKYGASYEITTIVNGESSTQTVSVASNFSAILFLFWLLALMIKAMLTII